MFEDLNSAKAKIQQKQIKKLENADEKLIEGINLLKEFSKNYDQNLLKKSASVFFEIIKVKKNKVEPFFYLSYIFYLFDDKENSIKYMNLAESIDNKFSKLSDLRKLIYQ